MLNDFQLINMNGRMYDPVLGRFLSPDNYVQMPTSAQSFNRYSYCLNNPLKYVDPDGENPLVIIGFVVGAYIGGSLANNGELNPLQWDYKEISTYLGIGVGALIGGVSGYALVNPGSFNFVFNATTPWTSVGTTLSADIATVGFSTKWKFDFHWTTKAGGEGSTEYSQKKLDKKTSDIYDNAVNKLKYYYYKTHEIENTINTMVNSFANYGEGEIQRNAINFNKYFKEIDAVFKGIDILLEKTPKEKLKKAAVAFGEYYGARYTGMIFADLAAEATLFSGYGTPWISTSMIMGSAFGTKVGESVGGFIMAGLFDLTYCGWQTNKSMSKFLPYMRWINQQNSIMQNEFFYNNYYNSWQ